MKKNNIKKQINKISQTYAVTTNPYDLQLEIVKRGGEMTTQDWKLLRTLMGVKTPFYTPLVKEVKIRERLKGGKSKEIIKLRRVDCLNYLDNEEVAKELKLEEIPYPYED